MKFGLSFLFAIFLVGCKTDLFSTSGKDKIGETKDLNQIAIESIKIDQTVVIELGKAVVKDNREIASKIALDLKYFPEPQMNKASLPQCYEKVNVMQKIGMIRCLNKQEIPIFASHIDQICEIDPDLSLNSQSKISISSSCVDPRIFVYETKPKVSIEVK